MSDLDNAINSINASAVKAENTATFLDDMSTFDDQSSVTNPNNGQTVASIPKQVKDRTDELFTAAESDINQAVTDAAQSATDAQDAADSIGRYQGLWPDTGGSANKGDTYQTQVSGTPTGQYFTALQDTTVDPVGDDVNWRAVVSFLSIVGENLIPNSSFVVQGSVTNPPDATPRSYNANDELFQGMFAVGALADVTYVDEVLNGTGQIYIDVYKTEKQKLSTASYVASIADSAGFPVESGASFTDNGDYWRVTFDMVNTFSVKLEQGVVATTHGILNIKDEVFAKTVSNIGEIKDRDFHKLNVGNYPQQTTKTMTTGEKILGSDLQTCRLEWEGDVSGLFYDANSTEPNDGYVSDLSLIGGGRSQPSQNSGILFESDSGNNPQRNKFAHLQIGDWSYAGVRFSGGWGNILEQSRVTNCEYGIRWDTSFLSGWAGSGQVTMSNYIASCGTGYWNTNGWNNVSINDIIQSCDTGITYAGNNGIFMGTWLEDNANDPLLTRAPLVLGGRGWTFRDTLHDDLTVPDEAVTQIDQIRMRMFRSEDTPMFDCGGRGVTNLNNVLPSTPQEQRNFQRTSSATYSTVWAVNSTNNYYDHENSQDPDVQLNPDFKTAEIRIEGNGATANSGTGNGRVVIATGSYKRDGTVPATPFRDQWEFALSGNLNPMNDGAQDIGNSSQRVGDAFLVNNPTIGSDGRVKPEEHRKSIPQELLDFVMRVENKAYKLAVNESGRDHFGIVIDEWFLSEIKKVTDVDKFAPLCHDIFTDEDGNAISSHLWGEKERVLLDYNEGSEMLECKVDKGECNVWLNGEVIGSSGVYSFDVPEATPEGDVEMPAVYVEYGGVRLGDFWQVRYTEWLILVNEGQRRINESTLARLKAIEEKIGL